MHGPSVQRQRRRPPPHRPSARAHRQGSLPGRHAATLQHATRPRPVPSPVAPDPPARDGGLGDEEAAEQVPEAEEEGAEQAGQALLGRDVDALHRRGKQAAGLDTLAVGRAGGAAACKLHCAGACRRRRQQPQGPCECTHQHAVSGEQGQGDAEDEREPEELGCRVDGGGAGVGEHVAERTARQRQLPSAHGHVASDAGAPCCCAHMRQRRSRPSSRRCSCE